MRKMRKAAELSQQIFKKLEESYVNQGNEGLKAAETAPAAQKKLDLVKNAADQFSKALAQNPQNQPAQEGVEKAEAHLPGLRAAAGQADLEKAKTMQGGRGSFTERAVGFGLEEGTALLDRADAKSRYRSVSPAWRGFLPKESGRGAKAPRCGERRQPTNNPPSARWPEGSGQGENQDGGGQGESDSGELGEGKLLPLSLSSAGSKRP